MIHLADTLRYLGRQTVLTDYRTSTVGTPASEKESVVHTITSSHEANGMMVVGLDSVEHRLDPDVQVVLWTAHDKVVHTTCGLRCVKERDHKGEKVQAMALADHIGKYIFVDTDWGRGPHCILSVDVTADGVVLTTTGSEIIGGIGMNITLLK